MSRHGPIAAALTLALAAGAVAPVHGARAQPRPPRAPWPRSRVPPQPRPPRRRPRRRPPRRRPDADPDAHAGRTAEATTHLPLRPRRRRSRSCAAMQVRLIWLGAPAASSPSVHGPRRPSRAVAHFRVEVRPRHEARRSTTRDDRSCPHRAHARKDARPGRLPRRPASCCASTRPKSLLRYVRNGRVVLHHRRTVRRCEAPPDPRGPVPHLLRRHADHTSTLYHSGNAVRDVLLRRSGGALLAVLPPRRLLRRPPTGASACARLAIATVALRHRVPTGHPRAGLPLVAASARSLGDGAWPA